MAIFVGLQLYSVREDASKNLYATLKKVKAMGYDGVEFAGLYGHTPEEVRDMCADIGLVPVCAHVGYLDMVTDAAKVCDDYKTIGCKCIAVPMIAPALRPDAGNFSALIENLRMFGKVAKEKGLTFLYHNHDFEFYKMDGKYGLDVIYDSIPADLLQTEVDTCWVRYSGVDPAEYLKKYAGRAPVVHLKDFSCTLVEDPDNAPRQYCRLIVPNDFEFRPVGYGMQDMPAIMETVKTLGTQWVVVEQDSTSMSLTALESAEKSRAYLKSIGV